MIDRLLAAGADRVVLVPADPRELRNVLVENSWLMRLYLGTTGSYQASLQQHPNPPAVSLTTF